MAVTYSVPVKTSRMRATRDLFAGGALEILAPGGAVLACFRFTPDGGEVEGDKWIMRFSTETVTADTSGAPVAAQLKTARGEVGMSGLEVGKGKDIEMSFPPKSESKISAGQVVELTSASIHHA